MRQVLLATPSMDGTVTVRYAHSAEESLRLCLQGGEIDLRTLRIFGDAMLPNVRNDLVAAAVYNNFDDMIFIDADQDWKPEWIPKLLSYPVDCVGAAVRKKTDQAELYNVRARGGPWSFTQHPTAPILTSPDMALGCGLLRFSKRALLALWNSSEPYHVWKGNEDKPSRWIFDHRPVDGQLVGEDTMVSDKLRTLGIPTWVDPNMTCGHMGDKHYTGDFAAWLRNLRIQTPQPEAATDHENEDVGC